MEYGVTKFVIGHYGNFDRLAVQAVTAAKKKFPDVTLEILLPYYSPKQTVELPAGADGFLYPEGMEKVPKQAAIVRANRYMTAHSDYLIAFSCHTASNTQKMVEYAKRLEKDGRLKKVTLLKPGNPY